jgi:hypothetical protein
MLVVRSASCLPMRLELGTLAFRYCTVASDKAQRFGLGGEGDLQ